MQWPAPRTSCGTVPINTLNAYNSALRKAILFLFCSAAATGGVSAAGNQSYTTWADYGGSADSMQYSALTQINKTNVKQLEPVWSFPVPGTSGRFGFNPLVVDDVMFVLGSNPEAQGYHVFALPNGSSAGKLPSDL